MCTYTTGNWTVKAKLSSKGQVRTYRNARGEGKVCTIELCDEQGKAVQVEHIRLNLG